MRKNKEIGIKVIAEKTGFSMSTVSRALNRCSNISAETTIAVLHAAREIGYQISTRRKTVAIILPERSKKLSWYSIGLMNALCEASLEFDYLLDFILADQMELLDERMTQGIISFDYASNVAKYVSAHSALPMICINDTGRSIDGIHSIFSDNRDAIMQAVNHLVGYGHRKIALFVHDGLVSADSRLRQKAFEDICQLYPLDPVSMVYCGKHQAPGGGFVPYFYDAILTAKAQGITAIINAGEFAGAEFLHALNYCKVKVPEEMSLITWEMPGVSQFLSPPVTTLEQNFPELARRSFETLAELMKDKPPLQDFCVPYLLHSRSSVALPF